MNDGLTDYGFRFVAAEVTRLAKLPDGSVSIQIKTDSGERIQIAVSAKGRRIRVFGDHYEGREW